MSISSVNGVASTVSRYRFVASGGETSLSGADANGSTLSYLAGKEEVYLNGSLLVRGQDYTGNDGATISSLTALVAGDTVEIITFVPFAIPTAISSATVTTAGDLIVATGASAVTRLGVGSSGTILTSNGTTPAYTSTVTGTLNNGTLTGTLTAASTSGTSGQLLSSTGTGVQWVAAPAAGSMTLLSTSSLSSGYPLTVSSINQGYKNLLIEITNQTFNGVAGYTPQYYPNSGGIVSTGYVTSSYLANSSIISAAGAVYSNAGGTNNAIIYISNYASTTLSKPFIHYGAYSTNADASYFFAGNYIYSTAITSMTFQISGNSTTWTGGTVKIYGVN